MIEAKGPIGIPHVLYARQTESYVALDPDAAPTGRVTRGDGGGGGRVIWQLWGND